MNDAELNDILAYCDGATPDEWDMHEVRPGDKTIQISGPQLFNPGAPFVFVDRDDTDHEEMERNAIFIARSRTDLPAVVKELQEARRLLEVVSELDRNEGDWWQEYCERVRAFLGGSDAE